MIKSYLNHISYYLPEKVLSNDELSEEFPDWSVEKIANKIGIDERHISADNEFSSDLGIHAAEQLFKESGFDRNNVDFLLFCTQSPDYFLPTTACTIQERLNLPKHSGALDFNLGCSGFIYGLSLAKGLIAAGIANNVLLICAETYSKFLNKKDKGNRTIFGDAASASLISNKRSETGAEILNFILGTDGSGAKNLIVKEGAMRYSRSMDSNTEDEYGNVHSGSDLYMNGPEIFNFTSKNIPLLIEETLNKNVLEKDDISYFVFHQANKYMLNHLRKKISIPEDKFPVRMNFCGNTVSSTIQIALKELEKEGAIVKGDKVLVAGFGVGYSWGATILQF